MEQPEPCVPKASDLKSPTVGSVTVNYNLSAAAESHWACLAGWVKTALHVMGKSSTRLLFHHQDQYCILLSFLFHVFFWGYCKQMSPRPHYVMTPLLNYPRHLFQHHALWKISTSQSYNDGRWSQDDTDAVEPSATAVSIFHSNAHLSTHRQLILNKWE